MKNKLRQAAIACIGWLALATIDGWAQTAGGAVQTLSPALLDRMRLAQKTWRDRDGAQLRTALFLSGTTPNLVVTLFKNTPPHESIREDFAIVTALEFLLANDAFEQVRITVLEYNPRRLAEQDVKDIVIGRRQFQTATTTIAKTPTTKEAVSKLRVDSSAVTQLCAQLGIK